MQRQPRSDFRLLHKPELECCKQCASALPVFSGAVPPPAAICEGLQSAKAALVLMSMLSGTSPEAVLFDLLSDQSDSA